MNTWDAITSRRNVRQYSDKPVTRQDLEKILEAGRRAPSASNWQPWNFIVVTDRATLQELATATSQFIASAPAAIVFVAKDDAERQEWIQYDFGQATMAMMLAATDLALGTGHASVKNEPVTKQLLGYPDGYSARYSIGVGYPADRELKPIKNPDRRPLDEIVHWNKW